MPLDLDRDLQGADPIFPATLHLRGGHSFGLNLSNDDRNVLRTVMTERSATPLQLRRLDGEILHLNSGDLVSVSSKFDLLAEQPQQNSKLANHLIIDDFLLDAEHDRLLQTIRELGDFFVPAGTLSGDPNARSGWVLYDTEQITELFAPRLLGALPYAFSQLKAKPFNISHFECQVTAYLDGGHYIRHDDNGSDEVSQRSLTFVYYLGENPPTFSGGEMLLWAAGHAHPAPALKVDPRRNRLVAFPSAIEHEVLPVQGPVSLQRARLTINGWLG